MNIYKALKSQIFSKNQYSIVPLRYKDRIDILKWRNEQFYHLRQNKILTKIDRKNQKDLDQLFSHNQFDIVVDFINYSGLDSYNPPKAGSKFYKGFNEYIKTSL